MLRMENIRTSRTRTRQVAEVSSSKEFYTMGVKDKFCLSELEWNLKSSHLASSLLNCGQHFSALRSSSRAISALLNYSHDSSQPLLSLKFFHLSPPQLNSSHLFSTLPNDAHLTHLFSSLLDLCQLFSTPLISSCLFSTHFIYSHLLSTLLSSSPSQLSPALLF